MRSCVVLPRAAAGEDRLPVVRDVVRPDVVLGPLREPCVLVRGVVRDEVEPDVDAVRCAPRRPARRSRRASRSRSGRRGSRRRRSPSRRSGSDGPGSARARRRRAMRGARDAPARRRTSGGRSDRRSADRPGVARSRRAPADRPSPLAFASCAWTSSSYESRCTSRNTPSGIAPSFSHVSCASANAVAKSLSSCVMPVDANSLPCSRYVRASLSSRMYSNSPSL